MSGKVRQRTAANVADSTTLTVNERILKECHTLYTDPDNGKKLCLGAAEAPAELEIEVKSRGVINLGWITSQEFFFYFWNLGVQKFTF